jgi:uncharacterized membrane protein
MIAPFAIIVAVHAEAMRRIVFVVLVLIGVGLILSIWAHIFESTMAQAVVVPRTWLVETLYAFER